MGPSEDGSTYLLLFKNDADKYVMLVNCARVGTMEVANGLLSWFTLFCFVRVWVSDQGSHFKNEVIRDLEHVLGAHHHFVTELCPWTNGEWKCPTGPFCAFSGQCWLSGRCQQTHGRG